jgi:hypothetical protein
MYIIGAQASQNLQGVCRWCSMSCYTDQCLMSVHDICTRYQVFENRLCCVDNGCIYIRDILFLYVYTPWCGS